MIDRCLTTEEVMFGIIKMQYKRIFLISTLKCPEIVTKIAKIVSEGIHYHYCTNLLGVDRSQSVRILKNRFFLSANVKFYAAHFQFKILS